MKTLQGSDRSAFSLIDLMAIIVVLGSLLVVCIPAFGRVALNSKSQRCLNNVRQLANAWRMYADDNRDRIVFASTGAGGGRSGSSVPVNPNPQDPNNYAWSGAHLDFSSANVANYDVNYDITKRPLWPYTGRDAAIYKCPEDQSSVKSAYTGKLLPRVQTMSMNTFLGGFAGTLGGLESSLSSSRLYLKTTEFTSITPAKLFVFTDQRPDSYNWSTFLVDMSGFSPSDPSRYRFNDIPGFLHDGGAAFAFADGSGELHRWQDARTVPPFGTNSVVVDSVPNSPNNPDVAWLQDHASRPK